MLVYKILLKNVNNYKYFLHIFNLFYYKLIYFFFTIQDDCPSENDSEKQGIAMDKLEATLDQLNCSITDFNNKIESLVQVSLSTWPVISSRIDALVGRCEENIQANNRILNWIEETNAAYSQERPLVCLDEMNDTEETCDTRDKEKKVNNLVNFLNNLIHYFFIH